MKMKLQIHLAVIAAVFFCGVRAKGAQPRDIDQLQLDWFGASSLKGVQDVYPQVGLEIVEANAVEPNFAPQIGPLTQRDLQNQLEQMLRQAGIRITNRFDARSANSPLSLNVTVYAKVRNDTPLPAYAVFVYIEAMQAVALLRDNQIHSFSRTWPMVPTGAGTRSLLFVTPDTIVKEITDEVNKQVTNFIIDFSAANPAMRIKVPVPPKPLQEVPEIKKTEPSEAPTPSPTAGNQQRLTIKTSQNIS
jgi:hypothetical protein